MKGRSSLGFGCGFSVSLLYSKEVSLALSDSEYKNLVVASGKTKKIWDSSPHTVQYSWCKLIVDILYTTGMVGLSVSITEQYN